MASTFWDPHGEARAALHAIASDPQYGVPALSSPQIMSNLLKDFLPDAPREASVLMAAAEARLAALLQDYAGQGMDPRNAAHLVGAFFASRTALTPDACDWAVGELMIALGINPHGPAESTAPAVGLDWSAVAPPPPPPPAAVLPPPPVAPPPPPGAQPAGVPPQGAPPLPAAALYGPPAMVPPAAQAGAPGGAFGGTIGIGQYPPGVPGEYLPAQRRSPRLGWLLAAGAAAVVIVVVAVLVLNKPGTSASPPSGVLGQATSVPASVLNAVGSGSAFSSDMISSIHATPLTDQGKPEVLFIGADFCPFCGGDQWSLIVALSRFGTFSGLRPAASATHGEPYPGTATMSFYKSSYSSKYLVFAHVDSETTDKTTLQHPTAQEHALWQRFDPGTFWPFLDIANAYKSVQGFYDLSVLHGKNQEQIAAALHDQHSPIAKAVDGGANVVTAALCVVTGERPGSVCDSSMIQSIQLNL